MTDVAALISEMVQRGVPADIVGKVAAALAEREVVAVPVKDEAAERRRAKDREAKAEIRRNRQTSAESADTAPPEQKDPGPQKTQTLPDPLPKEKPPTGSKRKGFPLPPDWRPSSEQRAALLAKGYADREIDRGLDRMRNWAEANAHREVARKVDWFAALRNWLDEERSRGPPVGQARSPSAYVC